jgi:hypothetical protein
MSPEDKNKLSQNKLSQVEKLKSKLFSVDYKIKTEPPIGFTNRFKKEVPNAWPKIEMKSNSEKIFFSQTSIFKKFFVFATLFFIGTLVYSFYVFSIKGNLISKENIDISILGNSFASGGEEIPLTITVGNRNNSALELVDLVIEYPKSSIGDSAQGEAERLRESLGNIPPGENRTKNIKLTLFGSQGVVLPVKILVEYRVEGSNVIFIKERIHEVSINSVPLNILVEAPKEVSPNQDITLEIKIKANVSKLAYKKTLIKLNYPAGFDFVSAKPSPYLNNNIWDLGNLPLGAERTISISGKMLDVFDGEEKSFHVLSGSQASQDKSAIDTVFNSATHTVLIQKPFIEARLFINDTYQKDYTSYTKAPIRGEIRWINNLESKISDLEIKAKISGNALDPKKIVAQLGFFNSTENSIIWNKDTQSKFSEINPGDFGSVFFSMSAPSLFSANEGILSDPSIVVDISISGKQLFRNQAPIELDNSESKKVKIISDVGFAPKIFYNSGSFTNTGPVPPKVGQETTYTVAWSLSNTANSISKTQVISTLPSWVEFGGLISPLNQDLTYNSVTREVVWKIGEVPKGTGITKPEREVAFRIKLTPLSYQLGAFPVLINDTILTGFDDFASVPLQINKTLLSTRAIGDPNFSITDGRVGE